MDPLIKIGTPAPDFSLPGIHLAEPASSPQDAPHDFYRLSEQQGKIVVLNFWSAECPWSERTDRELAVCMANWGEQVCWWSIAANAGESWAMIIAAAAARRLADVLLDSEQRVADLFGAQTTPHLFVIDRSGILRYQGAFDDVTFRQRSPTSFYLQEAVDALLASSLPAITQSAAYGCAIIRD